MILAQLLVNGVALGAAYALVALGFVLVLNATGAVNFAQGDLVMAGGFLAVALAGLIPAPGFVLLPLVMALMALLGLAVSADRLSAAPQPPAGQRLHQHHRRRHHPPERRHRPVRAGTEGRTAPVRRRHVHPCRPPDPRTIPRRHRNRRPADRGPVLAVHPHPTRPPPAGDGAGPRHGARLRHPRDGHDRPHLRAGRRTGRSRRAAAVQPVLRDAVQPAAA